MTEALQDSLAVALLLPTKTFHRCSYPSVNCLWNFQARFTQSTLRAQT